MAQYHVGYNPAAGKIFAGTINKKGDKWVNNSDVTDEALVAVRDHFMAVKAAQEDNPEAVGYQWQLSDGHTITLKLTLDEAVAKEKEN